MTARVTQTGFEALTRQSSSARVTQLGVEVLYKIPSIARVTQLGMEVLQGPEPKFLDYLFIPEGEGQSVTELDGHSSLGAVDAQAIDPTGDLRKLVTQYATGRKVRIIVGFPGENIGDFVTRHTMQLMSIDRDPKGRIHFWLAGLQRYLMKQAWTNGGPITLFPGMTATQPSGPAFAANPDPVSDKNPRYLQGNPIDIALVAMQNELGLGQSEGAPVASWQIYVPGNDATLINPNPYLDVPAMLALRDGQFAGCWFEFKITSSQDGKSWIEDQIWKPLGLYAIERADGKLSPKSMKSPATSSPFVLTDDNIIGTPATEHLPVVNVVNVTPGTDDGSQATPLEYIDEASDAVFNEQYNQDVQADGLRPARGAFLMGYLLSDKIFRRHAGSHAIPVPVYNVDAFLPALKIEVGDRATLTHRLMMDELTGGIGITAVECEVIDWQPHYPTQGARISLKLADTRFMKETTPYEIAPAGTPDWTSASAGQKAQYMFIASSSNGSMSDGTPGNAIF